MKISPVVPLLALIIVAGCTSGPTSQTADGGVPAGIRVVSPDGRGYMAWGNPSTPDDPVDTTSGGVDEPPSTFRMFNPYPNPMQLDVRVPIAMPASGALRVWVEQIGFPGWLWTSTRLTGATVTPDKPRHVVVIFDGIVEAGNHYVAWRPAPSATPKGIYRIHAKSSTATDYRDVMLYHTIEDLPNDLQQAVRYWD